MKSATRKLISNTVSNFAFRALDMLLMFISIPILIAYIGDDGFGIIVLVSAMTGYFGILNAGMPAGTQKYVAEYHERGDQEGLFKVINTSMGFFGLMGLVVSLGVMLFLLAGGSELFVEPAKVDETNAVLAVTMCLAAFTWPSTALASTLVGLQEFHKFNIINGLGRAVGQGLAIVVAVSGGAVWMVFLAREGMALLQFVLFAVMVKRELPGFKPRPWSFSKKIFRKIFGLSRWALISGIAGLLIYQTDKIIIGAMIPAVGALTVYTVIAKPFELIKTASGLFNSAVMPAVSAATEKEGRAGADRFIYAGARFNNAFVAPFAITLAYFSIPFIRLWVGERYVDDAWIAPVLCLFQLVWQSTSMLGRVYFGMGKAGAPAALAIFTAVVNVGLSIWLVTEYGVQGVLLATVLSGVVAIPVEMLTIFPRVDIKLKRFLLTVLVRGQGPVILAGACLLPLYPWVEAIDSWWIFLPAGMAMGLLLMTVSWFTAVPSELRRGLSASIRRKLSRS